MIKAKDIYAVFSAIVPLYVALILAYSSVRWWKIFTPQQALGINRFVTVFAVPLLSFHFISNNNPYQMNYRFLAADSLQKIVTLFALFLWQVFSKRGTLEWIITLFSLSTLPNTLIMGIPLLTAMYGPSSGSLMVQIVVLQSVIWYTLLLCMFEYRGAKLLVCEQFPETGGSIVSFKVDNDVVSLNGREPLETEADIGDNGRIRVRVRRSNSNSIVSSYGVNSNTPRASNFTGVEIYSVQSSREETPRVSGSNQADLVNLAAWKGASPRNEASNKKFGWNINGDPVPYSSDMNMFIWSSSSSPASEVNAKKMTPKREDLEGGEEKKGKRNNEENEIHLPPASVMTRLILLMVWRKLIRNPNTYACALGLIWSLISFRWNIKMPLIVKGSISILSDAGLGMAMFSLGLFMAMQPRIIACGIPKAAFAMAVRFLTGPAVIATTSIAIGLRGDLLHVAIVQASLPQGIVPFVFAKEYDVHPEILSTAVIFGMLIALPITILYYVLLGI